MYLRIINNNKNYFISHPYSRRCRRRRLRHTHHIILYKIDDKTQMHVCVLPIIPRLHNSNFYTKYNLCVLYLYAAQRPLRFSKPAALSCSVCLNCAAVHTQQHVTVLGGCIIPNCCYSSNRKRSSLKTFISQKVKQLAKPAECLCFFAYSFRAWHFGSLWL